MALKADVFPLRRSENVWCVSTSASTLAASNCSCDGITMLPFASSTSSAFASAGVAKSSSNSGSMAA